MGVPPSPIYPLDYASIFNPLSTTMKKKYSNHGTSVLEIIHASINRNSIEGIAPNAAIQMCSVLNNSGSTTINTVENAILSSLQKS